MAKIKSLLGPITGVIGEMVFRRNKGTNYISSRPSSYMPGTDQDSVNRRSHFAIAGKLADAINTIPFYKKLWAQYVTGNLSPYNMMMKYNYPYCSHEDVLPAASTVPDIGFGVPNAVILKTSAQVKIDTDPLGAGTDIDPVIETHLFCAGVIALSGKKDDSYKDNIFLSISFPKIPTNLVNPLTFTHTMNDVQSKLFDMYNNAKAYFAIMSLDAKEKPVHFSSTLYSA